MKKLVMGLILMLYVNSAGSQWRKIKDFVNTIDGQKEAISCIYFLNQPGSSGTGYLGTFPELWKTVDGGATWKISWPHAFGYGAGSITDIVFKDSLIGWFAFASIDGEVYRTTDGGGTWQFLPQSARSRNVEGIHYCAASNRLILCQDDSLRVSTDLGDTWETYTPLNALFSYISNGYFSFFSDSVGILSGYYLDSASAPIDSAHGMLRTANGGLTWTVTEARFGCWQPLAIPGTPICFADGGQQIYRSDDYGQTWKLLKDFGPFQDSQFNRIGPMFASYIAGDLSRLYIQSDTGLYVSMDEGITWKFDGGPPGNRLFSGKGKTFAALNAGGNNYGSLWEEDWPEAGVAANTAPPPSEISLSLARSILTVTSARSMSSVVVFDVLGRAVASSDARESRTASMDVGGTPAGVYFVRVTLAQAPTLGEVRTVKLVKN